MRWVHWINRAFVSPFLVNSLPKAGTHLLIKLATLIPGVRQANFILSNQLPQQGLGEKNVPVGVEWLRVYAQEQLQALFASMQHAQFAKAHTLYTPQLSALVQQTGFKMLLILRYPRAVAVSHARYLAEEPAHPLHSFYPPSHRKSG